MDLIIISGASKGIGLNIFNKCKSNCKYIIPIASSDKILELKGDNSYPLQLDLSNYHNVYNTISKLDFKINSISLVLCGARLGDYGGLLKSDLNDWEKTYNCNVLGNLAIIKACEKFFNFNTKIRIVFFAGGGAAFSNVEFSGYALSKVAVVREVENLSVEFKDFEDFSAIALAPGAVETDMLKTVVENGGFIRTKTDISEPTNFVYDFISDIYDSKKLNGKFIHVRDNLNSIELLNNNIFKLRRIE